MRKLLFAGIFVLFVGDSWGAADSDKIKITNNTKRELIFLTNLALYDTGAKIQPSLLYLKSGKTGVIDAPRYLRKTIESINANPMIVIFRDELDPAIDGKVPFHPAAKQIYDGIIGDVDEIAALKDKLLGVPGHDSLPAFRIEKKFVGLPGQQIYFERNLLGMNPYSLVENNAVKVIGRRGNEYQFQLERLPSSLYRISNFVNNSYDLVELSFANVGNRIRVAPYQTVWFDASKKPPIVYIEGQEFRPALQDGLKYFRITYDITPEGDRVLRAIVRGKSGEELLAYYAQAEEVFSSGRLTAGFSGSSSSTGSSVTPSPEIEESVPVQRASHGRKVRFDLPEDFEEKETRQKIAQGKYKPAFSCKKK